MTVVVGYVPTKEGEAALRRAADESVLRREDLVVVRPADTEREGRAPEARRLDETLARVRVQVAGCGRTVLEHPDADGLDTAEALMAAADAHDASCIVIGLRRRSAVGKLLLGSSAQRVLLEASCPVIAVKAQG